MSNAIIVEEKAGIVIVRFNRPEIRSPLSVVVLNELHRIIDSVSANESVKKLIFTGVGEVFASGADLREIAELTEENVCEFALYGQSLMTKIAALSQITIAAINGYCYGGALDLSLACDIRIVSPNATFAHPGTGLGIITGWGGTQRLPRLIGQAKALEMFFTATAIGADEALGVGLVDRIAADPLAAELESKTE